MYFSFSYETRYSKYLKFFTCPLILLLNIILLLVILHTNIFECEITLIKFPSLYHKYCISILFSFVEVNKISESFMVKYKLEASSFVSFKQFLSIFYFVFLLNSRKISHEQNFLLETISVVK